MSTINSNGGFFEALNSSVVPLNSGDIFEGIYNSCLNFSTIEVSVKTDTIYDISVIYSADGTNNEFIENISMVAVSADTLFYKFEPKMRYFKIKLENTDITNQTELSLQCLLKSSFVYSVASGGASNVNIISPLSGGGVAVTNSDITNIYNVVNSRGTVQLYNGSTATPSSSLNLSNVNNKSITVYGSVDAGCILTLEMSNNNINFYKSQYSYTLASLGDFGFCIAGFCPKYLRVSSNNNVNCILYVDYC